MAGRGVFLGVVLVMSKGRVVDILPVRSFTLDSYSHSLLSFVISFLSFLYKRRQPRMP